MADIVRLVETNTRDPVLTLRQIADEIEAGDFGPVGCVAIVVMGNQIEVIGAGEDYTPPSIGMLLYAGFFKLLNALNEHGT